jgi:hypothetical protein
MSDQPHPLSRRLSTLTVFNAMRNQLSARNAIAPVVAAAAVLVAAGIVATIWTSLPDAHISGGGWFAMILGVLVTLGLGVGLMALVFISNRCGYDDLGHRDD